MKAKNKILSFILSLTVTSSGIVGIFSNFSNNFHSYGASDSLNSIGKSDFFVSVRESNVLGISTNEEYQVDGFEVLRVLEDEKYGVRFIHFRHNKTDAQTIVCLGGSFADENSLRIYFNAPLEDNSGINHVLEHCVAASLPYEQKKVTAFTNAYSIHFDILDTNDYELFSQFLSQIKNPDFKNPKIDQSEREVILQKECYHEKKGLGDQIFPSGRIYHEISNVEILYPVEASFVVFDKTKTFMPRYKSALFYSPGTIESIKNITLQDVEKVYDKYIHPSNSLTFITGNNWKNTLKKFRNEYLNEFDKRDFNFDYNFESFPEAEVFSSEKIKKWDFFVYGSSNEKSSQYKAFVGYDLGELNEKEIEVANVIYAMLKLQIKNKEYSECDVFLRQAANKHFFLTIDLYGDDPDLFNEKSLKQNTYDALKNYILYAIQEAGNSYVQEIYLGYNYHKSFFGDVSCFFALFSDPFIGSNLIENNKISHVFRAPISEMEKFLDDKVKSPTQITVFEKDETGNFIDKRPHMFQSNELTSENQAVQLFAFDFVDDNIGCFAHGGLFYVEPRIDIRDKKIYINNILEKGSVEYLEYYFENEFPERAKNFKVTPEILEIIKSRLINYAPGNLEFEELLNSTTPEEFENILKELSVSYTGKTQ